MDVPSYNDDLKNIGKYLNVLDNLCNITTIRKCEYSENGTQSCTQQDMEWGLNQCRTRARVERQMWRAACIRNIEINHLMDHHKRSRRGLVNGLGSFIHYITGVMDNNDSENIYTSIKSINETEKKLIEASKDKVYVVGKLRKEVNDNLQQIHGEQNQTQVIINKIVTKINDQYATMGETSRRLRIVEKKIVELIV